MLTHPASVGRHGLPSTRERRGIRAAAFFPSSLRGSCPTAILRLRVGQMACLRPLMASVGMPQLRSFHPRRIST